MLLIHRYFSYVFLMQNNCSCFDGFNNIEQGRATRKRRRDNVSSRHWFNVNSLS